MSHSAAALLKAAVRQSPAFSAQGALERLFCHWFSGFVYSQIWEDPRVDIEAFAFEPHHRVLTIASGGCNVCHYLLEGVEAVDAVDINIHHVHLSRLKLACAARLPSHEDFFRFFGRADDNANVWAFTRHVEAHLPADTAAYWREERGFPGRPRIELFTRNIYEHARMGRFLRLMRWLCRLGGRDPERILQAKSLEEQRELYLRELDPLFSGALARVLSRSAVVLFSLGVPPQQHRALKEQSPGGVLEEYRKRVEKLACGFPLQDNPFAWQAFGRRYGRPGTGEVPAYLRPGSFAALKKASARAAVIHDSLAGHLARQSARSLDRFSLLDSQDWMTPKALTGLWEEITRTARPGARVAFRTGAPASPLEAALPPALLARWKPDMELSRRLTPRDRSCLYGGFHLYRLAE